MVERRREAKIKEKKDNVSTKSQNLQKDRGQSWEQWSDQSWQTDADSASWREADDWYTAESSSQASAAAEEYFNMLLSVNCDFRILVLLVTSNLFSVNYLFDPSQRTITLGIDTAACKTVVPAHHSAARGYLIHKDYSLVCSYCTAGRDKSV